MPHWIAVILLGIIEGITEFLPVSSTGHLLIAEQWLPHESDLFNVVIQCGAVLAVLPLFPQRLNQFVFRWREPATRDYLLKILVAFTLTGIGGLILERKHFKLEERVLPIASALLVGGILFLVVERWLRGKPLHDRLTWSVVIAVGLGQLVAAIFPGTSRSGATIMGGMLFGLSRQAATEFSFFLAVPIMFAASGYQMVKYRDLLSRDDLAAFAVGFIVSFAFALLAVKALIRYVARHDFKAFAWYRIALGIAVLAYFNG
jgi:undecaprenyl-diphosphatase